MMVGEGERREGEVRKGVEGGGGGLERPLWCCAGCGKYVTVVMIMMVESRCSSRGDRHVRQRVWFCR